MLFFFFGYEPGCKAPHNVNYTSSAGIILILSNNYIDYQHIQHAESIVLMANYPYLQYNGEGECREASSLVREEESTGWARMPKLLDERAQERC